MVIFKFSTLFTFKYIFKSTVIIIAIFNKNQTFYEMGVFKHMKLESFKIEENFHQDWRPKTGRGQNETNTMHAQEEYSAIIHFLSLNYVLHLFFTRNLRGEEGYKQKYTSQGMQYKYCNLSCAGVRDSGKTLLSESTNRKHNFHVVESWMILWVAGHWTMNKIIFSFPFSIFLSNFSRKSKKMCVSSTPFLLV